MFAQALAERLSRAGVHCGWATFETYLPAFYAAGVACLIAASAIWLVGRTQGARTRLVEASA